ncbi:MAG: alkaline phosphatase [Proteobacteria bacterium]|nr:MAG: alkaline phosphatase [Pseudomonadota bacterium]
MSRDRFDLPISRRRFLELVAASAAMTAAGCDFGSPVLPGDPFTLGVASGDPLADRVVLWTRLAPTPLAPDGAAGMPPVPVTVFWEVANDEAFRSIVRAGSAVADPSLGHSVHVDVNGLAPDRWYFYRFHADGHVSPVGRTRTFPAPSAAPALMRFASASCQNWKSGYYTAHHHLAQEDLDFVAFLGDYIYESGVGGEVRDHDGPRIETLAGYRNRYALYKSDPNLAEAHRRFPWLVTWDDHEVANNYAGELRDENGAPYPVPFLDLRAWAYQAWYENTPVRLLPPKGASFRIYRDLAFGDLAKLFVLDTRQYRTDQDCNDRALDPICATFPNPDGDMLGAAQESWLLGGLAASNARWNVMAQQVVFSPTPIGTRLNFDQWDGYPFARQRIVDFLRARPLRNSVILTGDIHASGVGWVPGQTPGAPSTFSDPIASEFVATGISSGGLDEGTASLIELLFNSYPHVEYFEAVSRGYVRHEVTRDAWRADYRFVETVLEESSPISTAVSFVVEHGDPRPQPA